MIAPVRRLDAWLLSPAPAQRLALLRIAIGLYGLVNVAVSFSEFDRLANRPASEFEPVGLAGVLSGPVPSVLLWMLFAALLVTGAAFVLGAGFRLTGPVFAFCGLAWATYHSSWGQLLHFEHVLTLHLLILGLSPAAEAVSVDGRSGGGVSEASVRYGWPIRLMAMVTVVTYSLAGVAKLRVGGLEWLDGSTLANHIAYSATRMDLLGESRPPLATLVVKQEWLLGPMAAVGLAVELLAPLALLGGRIRRLWVVGIVLFHLGTLTTMFVFFAYNGLGFALLPLFELERAQDWISHRRRRHRREHLDSVRPWPMNLWS